MVERGILLGGGLPLPKLVELAVEFERRGLDFIAYGEGRGSAVFPQLAGLATATTKIKLASWVVSIYPRSPVLIASGIACVDQLSGGRAMLGLGSSIPHIITKQHGFPFEKPAARMRDYVQIIRQLLTKRASNSLGGGLTFHGETMSVEQARIDIEPRQERIPIQVAAVGPHMLRVAGQYADGVIVEFISPGYLDHARAMMTEGAKAAERDPADIQIACFTWLSIGPTTGQAIERLKPDLTLHCASSIYDTLWEGAGLMNDALHVREAYLRGDIEEATRRVSDRLIKAVTIAGTFDECRQETREWIERFSAMGVTMFAFAVAADSDRETAYRAGVEVITEGKKG